MAERIGQVGEGRTEGEEGMERREGGREREKKMSFFLNLPVVKIPAGAHGYESGVEHTTFYIILHVSSERHPPQS